MRSEFPIELYRHKKTGGVYQFVCYAWIKDGEGEETDRAVVYKSLTDGVHYVRGESEFGLKFEKAGIITK